MRHISLVSVLWTFFAEKEIKIRPFLYTVESVLLYNSNTWTLTKQLEKSLNGSYKRMLRRALIVSWKQQKTNEKLYGCLPKRTDNIAFYRAI